MIVLAGGALLATSGLVCAQNSDELSIPSREKESRQQAIANKAARVAHRLKAEDVEGAEASTFTNVLVQQIARRPVTWTLDGATCSLVKSKLTATGTGKTTTTALQNRDGSVNIETVDEVTGTATDAKGNQFIFLYKITTAYDTSSIFPSASSAQPFVGPDNFQLIATSPGAQGYTVDIFFNAKIGADGSFTDLGTIASQDPNCDPI
jgi:hypothetical protein